MDDEVQEHNMYTDGEYLVEPEGEKWLTVSTGTHKCPVPDGDVTLPLVDNRDEGETWIWISPDTFVSVSRTMAQEIMASFGQEDDDVAATR